MTGVRLILKDHQWERMEPHLPGKSSDPGRTGTDNRLFMEAVLWLARTGAPWRDLPAFSATGTASSSAFRAGRRTGSGTGFLPPWRMPLTLNTS